jgi:hypothetical protein
MFIHINITLKDNRFTVATVQRARKLFNWQCADLIEIFINIAKLEWNKPLYPGTSIEQFGLDLLGRILAADVECLYDICNIYTDKHCCWYPASRLTLNSVIFESYVSIVAKDKSDYVISCRRLKVACWQYPTFYIW